MLRKTNPKQRENSTPRMTVRRRLLIEKLADRRVLTTLTGIVFDDANESFQQDPAIRQNPAESGLESRLVYLDHNDNATLDAGEPYQLTDAAGGFAFTDIADSLAIVRVFDGSNTQRQTFPVQPTMSSAQVDIAAPQSLLVDSFGSVVLTGDSIFKTNLETGQVGGIDALGTLTSAQRLSDGRVIAIGTNDNGETAWIVDLDQLSATPIDLSGTVTGVTWSSLALGNDGTGVLLDDSATGSVVRSIDASDPTNIFTTETAIVVAPGSSVVSSDTGNRSVIASPDVDGLAVMLWSNTTATPITQNTIVVSGISELLAFDDVSGLLAARTLSGGVSVLDVEASFAELNLLSDATGPVAIDAERELLFSLSPNDSLLVTDLLTSEPIAEFPISVPSLGTVTAIELGPSRDSVVLVGTLGLQKVLLRQPIAHRVNIVNGVDPDPIRFGFVSFADNDAPSYSAVPTFNAVEDQTFTSPAPAARLGIVDPQGDTFVLLQQGVAAHGQVVVGIDGSVIYTPNDDFFGTDSVTVILHDGADVSDPIVIEINVAPVPDPPTSVDITLDPTPENLPLGQPIGTIFVNDVDLNDNHIIVIDDPRFQVINGQIILIAGGLDFETEPNIPIKLTLTDPETGTEIINNATLTIQDANDPITGIGPANVSVFENIAGELISELIVFDVDADQSHTLEVLDDERFVIDGFDLRLADGVSLDYEATQSIVINVKATEIGTGGTFTQAITVSVRDFPEQPQSLSLSNTTVFEETPGDTVGDVLLDGLIPDNRYTFSVDDARFEVAGHVLKLVEGVSVDIATQSEIQLEITATDSQGQFNAISKSFVITVIKGDIPFHNDDFPEDVDGSGTVTAADALEIVHYLNVFGPGPVGQGDPGFGFDVNADGSVTALDALIVINFLNQQQFGQGGGTVGGEPEQLVESGDSLAGPTSPPTSGSDESSDNSSSGQPQTLHDRVISQFGSDPRGAKFWSSTAGLGSAGTDDDSDDATAAIDNFVSLLSKS